MHHLFLFLLFSSLTLKTIGQTEQFTVNDTEFIIKTKWVLNEWETYDTLKQCYRIEEGKAVYLLQFYAFKDDGSDCNNSFWNREELAIINNQFVFTTTYYQKTGMDPIPEKRKQIYNVTADGKLVLIFDKYKYRYNNEWTDL